MKFALKILLATTLLFSSTSGVFGHVTVAPNEIGIGKRVDFSVGVPNEKEIPTTKLRLVVPEGLTSVTPYVKPGWKIEMKKSGEGEEAKVTEITWSGSSIPAGQRDSFVFRAMSPSTETNLIWKAYQTYSDGTVVSWDQTPSDEEKESETSGPYSETKIVNDLTPTNNSTSEVKSEGDQTLTWVAYAALVLSVIALAMNFMKKKGA